MQQVQATSRAELDAWVEANAAAIREHLPADLVVVGHMILGGPVGAATGARYTVLAHGSELEYSMRGNAELSAWGAEAAAGAAAVIVGSEHIRKRRGRGLRAGRARARRARRGSTSTSGGREPRPTRSRGAAGRGAPRSAEPRQRRRAPAGRGQRRAARGVPRRRRPDGRLLRQADREQGRAGSDLGAARGRLPRRDRRLRAGARAVRAPGRGPAACSSPGRSSTAI